MSYNIWIARPRCDHCGETPGAWSWDGLTCNLTPMLERAGLSLRDLNDRPAYDCVKIVGSALAEMKATPDVFRAMNPSNGWGDYDGLLKFLEAFHEALSACLADGTVKVSW